MVTKSKTYRLTNVRWRIALTFVALSSVLYVVLALLAYSAFDWILNYSIDEQLQVLASDFGHAIELNGNLPHFRDWIRVVQTEPARSFVAIQLYDKDAKQLEHYGPKGPSSLHKDSGQVKDFRLLVSPLKKDNQVLGYLQIAMPTAFRDEALQKLELTLLLLAPILLFGLGLGSYVISDTATAPINDNLKMLKQFLADASHELNTPLGIFQARIDLLEKRLADKAQISEDISIINTATERMEKIINDLMLLAEIEGSLNDEVDVEESADLESTISLILSEFQAKFDNKGINLSLIESESLKVACSRENLHKILANLIENAWRYTNSGGSVKVSLTSEKLFAKIQVIDSGIGIAEENLPFIFDRFYRVDKSRSRQSGGSGLGLAIVRALVESKKGTVNVSSKVGEGSIFTVFLRIKQ
ncbi:MAG: HAMP domain-containing histidine kinase [Candidatus Obscuribacterales bacterium]|nr:HAMP domain-containing histidine kinase [Candidatus Obscuribacterales bacterium]